MKRLFDILAQMRRLSLTLLLIPCALYLSAQAPTHPFTINASGAQVIFETGSYDHTWSENTDHNLSKDEWEYLLSHHSWRFIQRTGSPSPSPSPSRPSNFCIVIYPDDYKGPIYGSETNYTGVEVDDDTCSELEEAGAQFLYHKFGQDIVPGYWTTTESDGSNGYYVLFRPGETPAVTYDATDPKTARKYAILVTERIPAPSCDCFTVTLH